MGFRHFYEYDQAITLDEYRALEAAGRITRPFTDPAIGADDSRRLRSAEASAAWRNRDGFDITSRTGQGAELDVDAKERARYQHRRARIGRSVGEGTQTAGETEIGTQEATA